MHCLYNLNKTRLSFISGPQVAVHFTQISRDDALLTNWILQRWALNIILHLLYVSTTRTLPVPLAVPESKYLTSHARPSNVQWLGLQSLKSQRNLSSCAHLALTIHKQISIIYKQPTHPEPCLALFTRRVPHELLLYAIDSRHKRQSSQSISRLMEFAHWIHMEGYRKLGPMGARRSWKSRTGEDFTHQRSRNPRILAQVQNHTGSTHLSWDCVRAVN